MLTNEHLEVRTTLIGLINLTPEAGVIQLASTAASLCCVMAAKKAVKHVNMDANWVIVPLTI